MIFMLVYYRFAGLIATVALALNFVIIMGVLALPGLGATLTLPGIAGIILTLGMAVDANVLIFERVREELVPARVKALRPDEKREARGDAGAHAQSRPDPVVVERVL